MPTYCPYCTSGCSKCQKYMKSNDNGLKMPENVAIFAKNTETGQQPDPFYVPGLDAGIPTSG